MLYVIMVHHFTGPLNGLINQYKQIQLILNTILFMEMLPMLSNMQMVAKVFTILMEHINLYL
jgi:hypothetical protein